MHINSRVQNDKSYSPWDCLDIIPVALAPHPDQAEVPGVLRTSNSEMEVLCYQHILCCSEWGGRIQHMSTTISSQKMTESRSHQAMVKVHRKHSKRNNNNKPYRYTGGKPLCTEWEFCKPRSEHPGGWIQWWAREWVPRGWYSMFILFVHKVKEKYSIIISDRLKSNFKIWKYSVRT